MYVRPQFRGLGLGKRMLTHLQDFARENGVGLLRLETSIYQTEAIGLYEQFGFQRVAPFGEYKEDPLSFFYETPVEIPMTKPEEAQAAIDEAYDAFRAGENEHSVVLSNEALEIGRQLDDENIIGQASTGLCRAALRDGDEEKLQALGADLLALAEESGNDHWRMIVTHMNAEMARMKGELERAGALYDESLRLNEAAGNENMVAAEYFNKSFVAMGQENLAEARSLLQRHFALRERLDAGDLNPYGLIAVATLLAAEGRDQEAALTTYICHRLFSEQEIVPDPADEAPLQAVEKQTGNRLSPEAREALLDDSKNLNCRQITARLVW